MKNRVTILLFMLTICACAFAGAGSNLHVVKFSVNPSDWKEEGPEGAKGSYLSFKYEDKDLTGSVADNGTALLYVMGTSGAGWYPLPHTYYPTPNGATITYNYQAGYIEIRMYATAGKLVRPASNYTYKLVIIPGEK